MRVLLGWAEGKRSKGLMPRVCLHESEESTRTRVFVGQEKQRQHNSSDTAPSTQPLQQESERRLCRVCRANTPLERKTWCPRHTTIKGLVSKV